MWLTGNQIPLCAALHTAGLRPRPRAAGALPPNEFHIHLRRFEGLALWQTPTSRAISSGGLREVRARRLTGTASPGAQPRVAALKLISVNAVNGI